MRSGAASSASNTPRAPESSPHEHGYDTKYALHALRIAHQGQELLSTGRITLPISNPEREHLLQVRHGEIALRSVLDRLHEQSALREETILSSNLADEPDREAVDRFLVDAYRRARAGDIASAPFSRADEPRPLNVERSL